MGGKKYLKRFIKYVLYGIPEKKIYVKIVSVSNDKLLENKNILITGGSSGIGKAIAKKSVQLGAQVIITGRDKNKLLSAQKEIGVEKCHFIMNDITNYNDIELLINSVLEIFKQRIDILINNAGIRIGKDFFEYLESDYEKTLSTNIKGHYFLSQRISKIWIDLEQEGNILMIASQAGIKSDPSPYGLSKASIIHFTKGLAKKLIENNIRVNAIAPGVTISSISSDNSSYNLHGNLFRENALGKRVLLPDEIAEIAVFLISEASRCINGEIISCNEGNNLL